MLEPAAPGQDELRAFLRVGGTSVARQQLALCLTLGCERIICISRRLTPELVSLQHGAEGAGAQFQVIDGARLLPGLVSVADEVIVLGDGLFASTAEAAALLDQGPGILVQPIEQGLAAGFERVDLNTASAAAMRLPGRLVDRLTELPPDCDIAAALLRIALQAGVAQRAIPHPDGARLVWTLVRSEDEAHGLEPGWIRGRLRADRPSSPGKRLARAAVRRLGPALLHAGNGGRNVAVGAGVLGLLAIGSAWLRLVPLGLAFAAVAWVVREAAGMLGRIGSDMPRPAGPSPLGRKLVDWGIDGAIVTIMTLGLAASPGQGLLARLFAPAMLVSLLRLVPRAVAQDWTAWLEDRALLCLLLAGGFYAGVGGDVVQLGALALAVAGLALSRDETR